MGVSATRRLVRTLLHVASFGCLLWALVLYGGDRGRHGDGALPRAAAGAYAPPGAPGIR